ncbi:MAG: hypothetical protein NPIRA03_06200 [Nitrospirales bacterium]|nr:MAG: hypothetical protein NPIRA03_06200 [Nitrospirales bacterium]
MANDMKEKAKEIGKQVQEKAGQVGEQVREQTTELANQAQGKVKSTLESQKQKGVGELSGLAEAVRQTSHTLREQQKEGIAQYTERAAEHMDRMAEYFESREVGELLNEAEMFARRHPEAFLGGAFMLGLIAGRFLKSSSDRRIDESSFYWRQESFRREEPMVSATPAAPTM